MTDLVLVARRFAEARHAGQMRKGGRGHTLY